jgi:hypothetical protein
MVVTAIVTTRIGHLQMSLVNKAFELHNSVAYGKKSLRNPEKTGNCEASLRSYGM